MEEPFVNDIENFMTEFVNSVEGENVMSIVGSSPDFDNADYFFLWFSHYYENFQWT